MQPQVESSSQAATDETFDAGVSQQDVSPICNVSYNIDREVSQDYALPSNIDPSNSKGDFTMQPFAIELFCGSAGLTATMRTLMPSSFGVDHNVVCPKSRVIQLNLLDETNQKLVEQWAKHPNCGSTLRCHVARPVVQEKFALTDTSTDLPLFGMGAILMDFLLFVYLQRTCCV